MTEYKVLTSAIEVFFSNATNKFGMDMIECMKGKRNKNMHMLSQLYVH